MIHIHCFTVNPLGENCYILHDDTREGVVIDCGVLFPQEQQEIRAYISSQGIRLRYALQTHMHFDHVFGIDFLHQTYGLSPQCHAAERETYARNADLALNLCGLRLPLPQVEIEPTLSHGQTIQFGTSELCVLHTPGHTPGGLCFYNKQEGILFSGDTLFQGSVGRTDAPLGDWAQELTSIRTHLLPLPSSTTVYPGHGPSTTIGYERDHNPYLQ